MTRDEAYQTLIGLVKNENLIKHHLATEAAMKALYRRQAPQQTPQEEEDWGIVGLLHDADYELCKSHPEKHTLILEEKIGGKLDPKLMQAIKSHNWQNNGVIPKSRLDWSLYCCDELTGLIIAAALILPEKKLGIVTSDFVIEKLNDTSFAAGAARGPILMCEKELMIPLPEFVEIVLKSMQAISIDLGL
jgi:predicted hydrolase (HD superfamily)